MFKKTLTYIFSRL